MGKMLVKLNKNSQTKKRSCYERLICQNTLIQLTLDYFPINSFGKNRKLLNIAEKGSESLVYHYKFPRIVVGLVAFKMYYTNPFSKSYSC